MEGTITPTETKEQSLIVVSAVKAQVRAAGLQSAADIADSLNAEVARLIQKAIERTKANGRVTVRGSDI